jgi:phosphatidylinositol glycan class B
METALSTMAFYYYPWKGVFIYKDLRKCLIFAALACIIRPPSAIIWIFLCLRLLWLKPGYRGSILSLIVKVAVVAVGLTMFIDYLFYGEWILTPWNFFSANLVSGLSEFYGTHPFHWYFTQGYPTILLTLLPWAVLGLKKEPYGPLLVWNTVILSFIKHKEFRFLGPMLPIMLLSAGKRLSSSKIGKMIWSIIIGAQLALAFYLSVYHQRGVIDVTHYIRNEAALGKASRVFFLMPCHSTPYYSYIHYPVNMEFLTCEPPWNPHMNAENTEYLFYQNMTSFIQKKWLNARKESWPSHFVFFENLNSTFSDLILSVDPRYSLVISPFLIISVLVFLIVIGMMTAEEREIF